MNVRINHRSLRDDGLVSTQRRELEALERDAEAQVTAVRARLHAEIG
ncbi:MAG: hypothetical protein JO043_05655 [Candidatus Eremiobacteraeota bacterium]|nr:hypothetical protein [Candidatus Eremiobacteraeota bacterium]